MDIYKQVRIIGIDAPQLSNKRQRWKAAAEIAKDFVAEFLKQDILDFKSEDYAGKFGCALGDIVFVIDGMLIRSLREVLLDKDASAVTMVNPT